MEKRSNKKIIFGISEDYFNFLAKNYPVICESDEFYFFPRVKRASIHFNLLDNFDKERIKQNIHYIKQLSSGLEKVSLEEGDLETYADFLLLRQSISTFLREFEKVKIWQINPSLYLLISVLGIEHLLIQNTFLKKNILDALFLRIKKIPRLLNQGKINLKKVPFEYLELAIKMSDCSINYFKNLTFLEFKPTFKKELNILLKKVNQGLEDFKKSLNKKSGYKFPINKNKELLKEILKDSFSCKRSLEEMFNIAFQEYRRTLKELIKIAKIIDPQKTWQEILSKYNLRIKNRKNLLNLYSTQIKKLKKFLKEKEIITLPKTQKIIVRETPQYLRPIRASASYSCPLTRNKKEPAFFYITPDFSNIHNEYIFVTAHETYPGHHLLDSIRKSLKNPIRVQVESPLFYEGWASFSEELTREEGYTKDLRQKLIGLKRQAWRAIRAMLDIGIRINKLKVSKAKDMLKNLGYSDSLVEKMVKHYLLTPGYQLCYTIGKFEFQRLRKKFAQRIGLKKFYDFVLKQGQIPFAILEKKLEVLDAKRR